MLGFPAHSAGDPVGCRRCLVVRVHIQLFGEAGDPQQSLVMHELAVFLVILVASLWNKISQLINPGQVNACIYHKTIFCNIWFNCYSVIAIVTLFKVRSRIVAPYVLLTQAI